HGRPPPALLLGERLPPAARSQTHLVPELVEVVGGRHVLQPFLELRRQVVVGGSRVHEGGGSEHPTIAPPHLHGVEHVQEPDGRVVGHVGVPVLSGIGEPDRPAVLDHVGQDSDLWHLGVLEQPVDRRLDVAEAPREISQVARLEALVGEAQDAVLAEGGQDDPEIGVAQRTRTRRWGGGRARSSPRTAAPRICPVGSIVATASRLLTAELWDYGTSVPSAYRLDRCARPGLPSQWGTKTSAEPGTEPNADRG